MAERIEVGAASSRNRLRSELRRRLSDTVPPTDTIQNLSSKRIVYCLMTWPLAALVRVIREVPTSSTHHVTEASFGSASFPTRTDVSWFVKSSDTPAAWFCASAARSLTNRFPVSAPSSRLPSAGSICL